MRKYWLIGAMVMLVLGGGRSMGMETIERGGPPARFSASGWGRAVIADGMWAERREQVRTVTLPDQWQQLEAHHHLDNFRVAAGEKDGVQQGLVFFDSDLYKWLEAAGYVLGRHPEDRELQDRVNEITGLIVAAQMPDGYLNTYYQSFAPAERWRVLWLNHELYCAGHFMEAACAHAEATGDDRLLAAAEKLADHIAAEFGPGKNEGVPGHEEIELALVRLYRLTGNDRYLDLAAFFVHQRGRDRHFRRELIRDVKQAAALERTAAKQRKPFLPPPDPSAKTSFGTSFDPLAAVRSLASFYSGKYFQADRPLVDQTVGEGHAVRAMYFYTGAADLYLETGDERIGSALTAIWDHTISRRTYLTGGMGSVAVIEGFGKDDELPNKSYTETCAAIASFFFSWRMLEMTGDAQYADQMERTLYNAILAGIALDGKHYFYQGPLAAFGDRERQAWYKVACCPPNLARLFSSLERYLYGGSADGLWVHQYVSGSVEFERPDGPVRLEVESGFPWSGRVTVRVRMEGPQSLVVRLRAPAWAERIDAKLNGRIIENGKIEQGYLALEREWKDGDEVDLDFVMSPRLVLSRPEVKENRGKVAIMRGPLVYCLEDVDNPGVDVHKAVIGPGSELTVEDRSELLGGVRVIRGRTAGGADFTAIPYYTWANRGRSHMEVWIKTEGMQP